MSSCRTAFDGIRRSRAVCRRRRCSHGRLNTRPAHACQPEGRTCERSRRGSSRRSSCDTFRTTWRIPPLRDWVPAWPGSPFRGTQYTSPASSETCRSDGMTGTTASDAPHRVPCLSSRRGSIEPTSRPTCGGRSHTAPRAAAGNDRPDDASSGSRSTWSACPCTCPGDGTIRTRRHGGDRPDGTASDCERRGLSDRTERQQAPHTAAKLPRQS